MIIPKEVIKRAEEFGQTIWDESCVEEADKTPPHQLSAFIQSAKIGYLQCYEDWAFGDFGKLGKKLPSVTEKNKKSVYFGYVKCYEDLMESSDKCYDDYKMTDEDFEESSNYFGE